MISCGFGCAPWPCVSHPGHSLRLPESAEGMAGFHALIAEHLPTDGEATDVVIGIETDRSPWITVLIATSVRDQPNAGGVVSRTLGLKRSARHRLNLGEGS
jgi:hypothetical protein